jgi:DNA-binding CsgD family transcriptional regulator
VRRVVLTRAYHGDRAAPPATSEPSALDEARLLEVAGGASAKALLARYCKALYARHRTYEEVARRTGLDRRTAKAYVAGG